MKALVLSDIASMIYAAQMRQTKNSYWESFE